MGESRRHCSRPTKTNMLSPIHHIYCARKIPQQRLGIRLRKGSPRDRKSAPTCLILRQDPPMGGVAVGFHAKEKVKRKRLGSDLLVSFHFCGPKLRPFPAQSWAIGPKRKEPDLWNNFQFFKGWTWRVETRELETHLDPWYRSAAFSEGVVFTRMAIYRDTRSSG